MTALQDPTLINNQTAQNQALAVSQAINLTLTLTSEQATIEGFGEGWARISRAWGRTGTWREAHAYWTQIVQTAYRSTTTSEYWDSWILVLQRIEEATAAMIYLESRGFSVIGRDIPRPSVVLDSGMMLMVGFFVEICLMTDFNKRNIYFPQKIYVLR